MHFFLVIFFTTLCMHYAACSLHPLKQNEHGSAGHDEASTTGQSMKERGKQLSASISRAVLERNASGYPKQAKVRKDGTPIQGHAVARLDKSRERRQPTLTVVHDIHSTTESKFRNLSLASSAHKPHNKRTKRSAPRFYHPKPPKQGDTRSSTARTWKMVLRAQAAGGEGRVTHMSTNGKDLIEDPDPTHTWSKWAESRHMFIEGVYEPKEQH